MKKLIIIPVLFLSLLIKAQKDSIVNHIMPTNEFSLTYKQGWMSANKFTPQYGKNYFDNYHNHVFSFRFDYSRYILSNMKFGGGIEIGAREFEFIYTLDEKNFPGLSKYIDKGYYYSGRYAFFSVPYEQPFFSIPIHADFQLLPKNKHHELWISLGTDFRFIGEWQATEQHILATNDTTDLILFKTDYRTTSKHFNTLLTFGLHYDFTFANINKLRVGIKTGISFNDQITGTYTFLPEIPDYKASGTFTNKLSYVGIDLGYAINNRNILLKKSEILKQNHNADLNEIRESLIKNECCEIYLGTTLIKKAFINTKPVKNKTILHLTNNTSLSFYSEFIKKINEKSSLATGIEYHFNLYEFTPHYFTTPLIYINLPLRYYYNIKIGKKSKILIGGGLSLMIHTYDYDMHSTYFKEIPSGSGNIQTVLDATITKSHIFDMETNFVLRYSRYTKRYNKFYISARYNYIITTPYTVDYKLLQNDGTYFKSQLKIRPQNLSLTFGFAFTFKKK